MKSIQLRISQTVSTLKGFARQFRIECVEDPSDPGGGAAGFGPREFMKRAKKVVKIKK